MTAVGLGQHGSPAEGPGPSLYRGKYFHDFTGICQKFHSNGSVPIAQWVGQQGSEPVGPFSSLCRNKYFHDFTDICQKLQWFPWHSG